MVVEEEEEEEEDEEVEFDEFDDEGDFEDEEEEESLPLLSTAEIATCSFDGGRASPSPRSLRKSAEMTLLESSPPPKASLPSSIVDQRLKVDSKAALGTLSPPCRTAIQIRACCCEEQQRRLKLGRRASALREQEKRKLVEAENRKRKKKKSSSEVPSFF